MRPLPVTGVGHIDSRRRSRWCWRQGASARRRVRLGRAKGLPEAAQSYVRSPHDPQPDLESPFQHRQQGSAGAVAGAVVGRARGRLNTAGQVIQPAPDISRAARQDRVRDGLGVRGQEHQSRNHQRPVRLLRSTPLLLDGRSVRHLCKISTGLASTGALTALGLAVDRRDYVRGVCDPRNYAGTRCGWYAGTITDRDAARLRQMVGSYRNDRRTKGTRGVVA